MLLYFHSSVIDTNVHIYSVLWHACNKNYYNADIGPMVWGHNSHSDGNNLQKGPHRYSPTPSCYNSCIYNCGGYHYMALVNVCSLRTMPVTTSQLIEQHKRVEKSFLHVRYKHESHCGKVLLTTLVNVTAIFTICM